ncbi:MAG: poly-gamma-glutamate system protein, partial [Bacteroidota bacterium]
MNISIRSTKVLSLLGLLAIGILLTVEHSKFYQRQDHHDEKIRAAQLAQRAMQQIKAHYFPNEIALDNINDPNQTGMIGQQFSAITSGRGSLPIKLSTTNPNFAAMVVQQIKAAGLQKGDHVGLCFTGSFPALNIATYAALEVLELNPILIASVSSSSWGANSPDLTWLDMHQHLYQEGLFSTLPVAASIGGNQDLGRTLSKAGRQLALKAIERNSLPVINEGSLEKNIQKRMVIFNQHAQQPIRLMINVGGGVASLGGHQNASSLPAGLSTQMTIDQFKEKRGILYEMTRRGVPIINLLRINQLMAKYDLPRDPVPLPAIGEGALFIAYQYNLKIVIG